MENLTIKKHVTLVAAFHIGISALGLIGATIIFLIFSFAGSFVQDVDATGSAVLKFLSTFLPSLIFLISLLSLIGGIGLLNYQKWARILMLVVSAIMCFAFPFGTIVGVYSLWVLLQDESVIIFH
jgi:hypothetical protein